MSDFTKLNRFERVAKLNGASAKARAVWAMAHNALDRRGQMELGGADWKSVLCRRLGIETSERQWFHAGLRELEQRELVSVVDDVFTLHGHAEQARAPRTSSGPVPDLPPTSPGPSSDLSSTSSGPVPDLPPTSPGPSSDLHHGTSRNHSDHAPRARVQNREEERREEVEEGPSTGTSSSTVPDRSQSNHDASFDRANHAAIAAYRDGVADATKIRVPVNHGRRFEQAASLRQAIADAMPNATEADGVALIRRAAAQAAKDPDHKAAGTPFAWFVANIGRYVERAREDAPNRQGPLAVAEAAVAVAKADYEASYGTERSDECRRAYQAARDRLARLRLSQEAAS